MELTTLPPCHGAEAGGLNGNWFLQHRGWQGFYVEVHGHRLSRQGTFLFCAIVLRSTCAGSLSRDHQSILYQM